MSGDDFLYSEEELEEAFGRVEEGEDITLEVRDQDQCELFLDQLDAKRDEMGEIQAHYESRLQTLNDWRDRRLNQKMRSISRLKYSLHIYLRISGKKTLDLVGGVMRTSAGRSRIEVFNFDLLRKFADKRNIPGLLRQPPIPDREPDKKGIAAYFKDTKKCPPGCESIEGVDSFTVKTSSPAHKIESLPSRSVEDGDGAAGAE